MIQGEIYTFPLIDLIQWCALTERTGELSVEHGPHKVIVYFSTGNIAAVKFDLEVSDSPGTVRVMLATAVRWHWGHFEFKDGALPAKIKSINQNLAVQFILLEIIGESSQNTSEQPDVNITLDRKVWPTMDPQIGGLTLANELRVRVADRLIREDFQVSPMSSVAARLLKLTRDSKFSLNDLTDVVVTDQATIASIMRSANSALHDHEEEVNTLPAAVQRLGSDQVINISLAVALSARTPGRDLFEADRKRLWAHSSAAAVFAASVADCVGLDRNVAFPCGLLMDFGMSVLYTLIQDILGSGATLDEGLEQNTAEIVRVYHQGVGRIVGMKWRLPQAVVESMTYHHNLDDATVDREYVAVSSLADSLATYALSLPRVELEESLRDMPAENLTTHPAAAIIKLDPEAVKGIFKDIPQQLDEAQQLLFN